jgi:outer membrane protein insertion porin family
VLAIRLRGGAVLGRRLSLSDRTGFIPPQERLYAGGPTSVRGFQQNELGSKVYIARNRDVQLDTVVAAPNDTVFHFSLKPDSALINFDTDSNPDRAVPLGGNALIVANVEYRIRDPFLFPDRLQYTFFVDAGDVWTRGGPARSIKLTPGFGIRAITPVGPVQVNVGWNGHEREAGPLYYNPNVSVLACVSPGPALDYRRNPTTGQLETSGVCPDFRPPRRKRLIQQLTFTFSIGPDF